MAPLYLGPFRVLQKFDKYFRVQLDKAVDNIALHRIKPANIASEEYNGELDEQQGDEIEPETLKLQDEEDTEGGRQPQNQNAQPQLGRDEEIAEENEQIEEQNPQPQERSNVEQAHRNIQMENQDVRLDPVAPGPSNKFNSKRIGRAPKGATGARAKSNRRLTLTPSPERIRQSFTQTRYGRKSQAPKRYGI